jgi:Ca2+/H+ antiporter, TMEM165/GDT1 family
MKRRILFPFFALAALFLLSAVVMLLWNAIIPDLFKLGTLTYWQAMGLLILSKILFGGWHGHHRGLHRHWHGNRFLAEKWMSMSEEERAKFREDWGKRWCCSGTDAPKS